MRDGGCSVLHAVSMCTEPPGTVTGPSAAAMRSVIRLKSGRAITGD